MASGGRGDDDDDWEDASDIFEVRSEAGSSNTLTPDEQGVDTSRSGQLTVIAPPEDDRRERTPPRVMNQRRGRESDRDRSYELRDPGPWSPPSEYHSAPLMTLPNPKDSRGSRQECPPARDRSDRPNKSRDSKIVMKPPRFEGKEHCIESHLVQFEIVAKRNGWDDSEKADFLKCSLVGEASQLLRDLSESATYDDIVYKLRQRYGTIEQLESFRMELKQRKRRPGESLSSLLKDIRRIFTLAFPGPPNYMTELAAKDAFVEGLDDRELMIKVCEREPETLDQAYRIAERMELYQKIPDSKGVEFKAKQSSKVRAMAAEDDSVLKAVMETHRLMQKQLTMISESLAKDRVSNKKRDETEKTPGTRAKGRCHNCHELGHYRFECPALVKKPPDAPAASDATARTVSLNERKRHLTVERESNGTLSVAQKVPNQKQSVGDRTSTEAWLDIVRRCPPPPFSSGVPSHPETAATWKQSTPSELCKNIDEVTQHAQQSPEVSCGSSTQHAQQSPEVHPKRSTQHAQQSMQHTQQSAKHQNHLRNTSERKEQQPRWENRGTSTQHAQQLTQPTQHSQKTSGHAGKVVVPTRVEREVSSPGNKTCKTGNTLFIEVKIGQRCCPALLDTGSEVTLLPKHLADLSQLNRSSRILRAANGTLINIVGEWRTVVTIGPVSVTMNFTVSDQINELIFGIDWMRDNGCVLSFADWTMELQGYRFQLLTKTKSEPDAVLRKIPVLNYEMQNSQIVEPLIVHDVELKGCFEPVVFNSRVVADVEHCFCMLQESVMEPSAGIVRPFACSSCTRRFKRQFDLDRHERDKHAKEPAADEKREFACNSCSSSFSRQYDLDRHDMAKHLKIRVICPICEASLSSEGVLQRHIKTLHAPVPLASEAVGGVRRSPSSSRPEQNDEPESEIREHYSVLRVQEDVAYEGDFQLMEAEVPVEERGPQQKPRVPYEEHKGYGTLARVDPALATMDRPIRYLDLRPTTPEADEVRNTLERWRVRILKEPFPVSKVVLMEQFTSEEGDVGYPATLAIEQMIEMRLAVEAQQTALRLAAREQSSARKMTVQRMKERRSCTQMPTKPSSRAKSIYARPSRRFGTLDSGSGPDESAMAFRALKMDVPGTGMSNAVSLSVPREVLSEEMVSSPTEPEHDHFVFSRSEVLATCEKEL